ncbi:MAG TPA: LruC domain-containing protein, partial [Bacteroidia bacterium]|nr:LruC domain-containing protein [Bacteroidia bacterium]
STGKLISTGLTNAQAEYSTTLRVPAWQEDIYIEKINPDGGHQFEKVKASQFATALFTNGQQPATYIIRKSSGMDCSSGCDVVYHNPVSNIVVPTGKNVCITGTIGSGITLLVPTGSTARVCASGTFTSVSGNGTLIVLEGAILKINTLTSSLTNWSDSLWIDNPGSLNSELFYNHGKCYVNSVTSSNQVDNYGTLVVNGNFTVPGFNMARNYGYLKVSGNIYSGTLGYFTNNCRIEVAGNFYQEGEFHNYSYVKVAGTFDNNTANTDWPNAAVMHAGSMFSTKNFNMGYGIVYGSSSAIVKVTNNSTFSGGTLANVTYCDANGIESNTGGSTSTAVFGCSGTIPVSTCNPEGFGNAPAADADGDGAADAQDEYPNDATRAFNSYYPNAASTATLAFEDLWPSQGDYEFNDLTLAFNIQQVLNADNKVVEYKVKMKVKSVGGSFDNGFGFQLDELAPGDINSVTGQVLVRNLITRNANNTEAGQSKAVIICYDSPEPTLQRAAGSMFNTIKANGQGTSDSVYLSVTFTNPVEEAKLTIDKFNPFIFTNKRRGYEVHMGNYKPTSLANTALFGTSNDRTNPGTNTYYKNANGMPWAILIPEDFTYPTERTSVTAAYNFFDDWALSGGANYTNWYTTAPGNRNTDKLY